MSEMLTVRQASLAYASLNVVEEVSFSLERGQIGCLLGPSGCGKTSLLKAIAGFEPLTSGTIAINNVVVSEPGHTLKADKRKVGMVFQDFALFPHLNVAENIAFGLRDWAKSKQHERVQTLLELIELPGMEARPIHALSGGQQQRVALARALANAPDILLLDEPFSSLDAELRASLAVQLAQIIRKTGISALLVTHDKSEAFAMADVMGVMHAGKLMQWDLPRMIYQRPISTFVAEFMGLCGWLDAHIISPHELECSLGKVSIDTANRLPVGATIKVLFRPYDIALTQQVGTRVRVTEVQYRGHDFLYRLVTASNEQLFCAVPLSVHQQGVNEVFIKMINPPLTVF